MGKIVEASTTYPGEKIVSPLLDAGQTLVNTATGSAIPMTRDIIWETQGALDTHDLTRTGKDRPKSKLRDIAAREADKIVDRAEIYAAYTYSTEHQADPGAAFFDTYEPPIAEPITSPAQKYRGYSERALIREERLSREVEQYALDKRDPKSHSTPREDTYAATDGNTLPGETSVKIELGDSPAAARADIWARDPGAVPFEVREASDDVHLPREELLRRLEESDLIDKTKTRRQVIHEQFVETVGGNAEADRLAMVEANAILAEYELDNNAKIRGGKLDQRNSIIRSVGSFARTGIAVYGLPFAAKFVDVPSDLVNTIANFIESVPGDIANVPIPESWGVPGHILKWGAEHLREIILGTSLFLGTVRLGMKRLTDSMQMKAVAQKNDLLRELVAQKVHERFSVANG